MSDAISHADDYDTIVILDQASYTEGQIEISRPLTLTSLSVGPEGNGWIASYTAYSRRR